MIVFVRSLVLCNALLLALPQGWCCFVPLAAACPDEAPAKVAECCHGSNGVKHEPSTPKPEPVKPLKECCCQPVLAGPDAERFFVDLGLVVPLVAITSGPTAADALAPTRL